MFPKNVNFLIVDELSLQLNFGRIFGLKTVFH